MYFCGKKVISSDFSKNEEETKRGEEKIKKMKNSFRLLTL